MSTRPNCGSALQPGTEVKAGQLVPHVDKPNSLLTPFSVFRCYYSAADGGARSIVMSVCVCVCVCAFVCVCLSVRDHIFGTSDLHQAFCAYYLWPWLGPALAA